MRSFRCKAEFIDQGTLHNAFFAICPHQAYIATGSDAGVVNLYRAKDCALSSVLSSPPVPIKTLFNLKTEIDTIAFHPASQVLAPSPSGCEGDVTGRGVDDGNGLDASALCHEAGAPSQLLCLCQLAQSPTQQDACQMHRLLASRRFDARGIIDGSHFELPSPSLLAMIWHHLRSHRMLAGIL